LLAAPGVYKTTVDLLALVARANARLAQHQRLATAAWWPDVDFPRTAILKVKKHLLPPPEKVAVVEEQVIEADDPVGLAIMSVAKASSISRGQTLAELGLDSLGITELCAAIEQKTGRFVAEEELRAEMAVGEVLEVVERAPRAGAPGQPERAQRQIKYVGPWPYTWGRVFRFLAFPFDLAYRLVVTNTIVEGSEHLIVLPKRLIIAGVHHSYADVPLVKHALMKTRARRLAGRLMIAAAADGFAAAGLFAKYGILALGLYPLERGGLGEESLKQLADLAEQGNPVLIFPQGMHARPAQEIAGDRSARFRPGVARLARDMEAAVVPFGLAGTERAMPPYLEEFRGLTVAGIPVTAKRGPLAIAFGAPLTIAEGESDQQFTERLEAACFALTRQAERALASAGGRGDMKPAGA
jgi:1-acyl-sn-glycerol-3-phosphate acyltransferase/acyl carrier protein